MFPKTDSLSLSSIFKKWAQLFYDAGDKLGATFRVTEQMGKWPKDAGFTNITHKIHKVPLNPWPKDKRLKEQGLYCGLYMDLSLDGFVNFPVGQILGWTQEELQVLIANFRNAIRSRKNLPVAYM